MSRGETSAEAAAIFNEFADQLPMTAEVQAAAETRFGELGDRELEELYWHGLRRAIEWRKTAQQDIDAAESEGITQQTIDGAFATLIISGAVARTIAARQPEGQDPPRLQTLWNEAQQRYGHEDLAHHGQPAIVQFDALGRYHVVPESEVDVNLRPSMHPQQPPA